MSGSKTLLTGLLVVTVVVGLVYMVDPTFFGLMGSSVEGFAPTKKNYDPEPKRPLVSGPDAQAKEIIKRIQEKINATMKEIARLKAKGKLSPNEERTLQKLNRDIKDANNQIECFNKGIGNNGKTGMCLGGGDFQDMNHNEGFAGQCPMNYEEAKACASLATTPPPPSGKVPRGKERLPKTTSGFQGMKEEEEAFENMASVSSDADFGTAEAPAGCYPRDQLTPSELLPKDNNSVWAEQNPMGPGSLKGKNFLSAGALLGVNTVGQSLRNANLQLRSEPPNPQMPVSIFNQSTIQPDVNRRPLEIN